MHRSGLAQVSLGQVAYDASAFKPWWKNLESGAGCLVFIGLAKQGHPLLLPQRLLKGFWRLMQVLATEHRLPAGHVACCEQAERLAEAWGRGCGLCDVVGRHCCDDWERKRYSCESG